LEEAKAALAAVDREKLADPRAIPDENRSAHPMPRMRAADRPFMITGAHRMTKTWILALGLAGLVATASQASAGGADFDTATGRAPAAKPEFLGVDLDTGDVYYNGRNSGRYCFYRTVDVFNRYTGYMEQRRVRRCGHGLYLP
jgi:hypothetical protein